MSAFESTGSAERGAVANGRLTLPRIPGLDGLRALAILAVVLYHADLAWIPGGFIGVEVFFVLSGYLITASLLAEWRASGTIRLKAFARRRARRLIPAQFALVGAVLAAAALLLSEESAGLWGEAAAGMGYGSNWYLILARRSYFEAMGRPSLLRHLWYLAVQGQLYLIWPPVLAWALRRWPRRRILWLALILAAASAAWMAALYDPIADPSRVYFGTDTRASGFLIGAALSLVLRAARQSGGRASWPTRFALDVVGLGALAVLVSGCFWINEYMPALYRGGLVALALAAAVVVSVCAAVPDGLLSRLLSAQPLRWLGRRSYSLYLWHWPVFMVTRPHLDLPLDGPALLAVRFVLAGVLAELSYRLIEIPLRRAVGGGQPAARAQWAITAAVLVALCALLSLPMAAARPPSPHLALSAGLAETGLPQVAAGTLEPFVPAPSSTPATPRELEQAAGSTATVRPTWTTTPPPTPTAAQFPTKVLPSASLSPTWFPTRAHPAVVATATHTPSGAEAFISYTADQRGAPPATEESDMLSLAVDRPTATPTATPTMLPTSPLSVTAIGDSVMLGARLEIQAAAKDVAVDAAVGRQAIDAIRILRERQEAGDLGRLVILHLGSNGIFREEQFEEIMAVLADTEHVVFLNVRVPRRWQDPVNEMLAAGVEHYPNAMLLDWFAATADQPELFPKDGVHLGPRGAQLYAELIAACVRDHHG